MTFHFVSVCTISTLLFEAFTKYFTSIISRRVKSTLKNTLLFINYLIHPVPLTISEKVVIFELFEIAFDWLLTKTISL